MEALLISILVNLVEGEPPHFPNMENGKRIALHLSLLGRVIAPGEMEEGGHCDPSWLPKGSRGGVDHGASLRSSYCKREVRK